MSSKLGVENIAHTNGTNAMTISSGGVATFPNAPVGNFISVAQQWRLNTATNVGTNGDVTANWEVNDTSGYGGIGTGLTQSSGIFSFPSTGVYLIIFTARFVSAASDDSHSFSFQITTNNSSYNEVSLVTMGNRDSGGTAVTTGTNSFMFNVTNTSNDKFKFATHGFDTGTMLTGDTGFQRTGFVVMKIGA